MTTIYSYKLCPYDIMHYITAPIVRPLGVFYQYGDPHFFAMVNTDRPAEEYIVCGVETFMDLDTVGIEISPDDYMNTTLDTLHWFCRKLIQSGDM